MRFCRTIPYSALVDCLLPLLRRVLMLITAGCYISSAKAQGTSAYDAALAGRIDSSPLLQFRERQVSLHATLPGWALGAVSGVAVGHDGYLYVIQRGPDADPILVFDVSGNLVRSWGRGDFTLPHSLRLDRQGNVWAIDARSSKVIQYSSTGTKLLTISVMPVPNTDSPFRGATDLAFAPNGEVFITDGYGNNRVLEYTASGHEVREWGHPGTGPGEFHLPHAIQISSAGTVYVADRENGRIELFDLDGHFLRAFGELGKCYALKLHNGALWVTMGLRDQDPGTPGWLVKVDPNSGHILSHLSVPDQRAGHALDLFESGAVVETAGSGLLLFQTEGPTSRR